MWDKLQLVSLEARRGLSQQPRTSGHLAKGPIGVRDFLANHGYRPGGRTGHSRNQYYTNDGQVELQDSNNCLRINGLSSTWTRSLPKGRLCFADLASGAGDWLNQLALSARPNVGAAERHSVPSRRTQLAELRSDRRQLESSRSPRRPQVSVRFGCLPSMGGKTPKTSRKSAKTPREFSDLGIW